MISPRESSAVVCALVTGLHPIPRTTFLEERCQAALGTLIHPESQKILDTLLASRPRAVSIGLRPVEKNDLVVIFPIMRAGNPDSSGILAKPDPDRPVFSRDDLVTDRLKPTRVAGHGVSSFARLQTGDFLRYSLSSDLTLAALHTLSFCQRSPYWMWVVRPTDASSSYDNIFGFWLAVSS